MSTPSPQQPGVPGEWSVPAIGPADAERGTSPPALSPGVSAAVLRSPTAPTVPDADPANLLLAVSRIANALFGADAAAGLPAGSVADPLPAADIVPATPGAAPGFGGPPTEAPPTGPNPFTAPLNLDAPLAAPDIGAPGLPDQFRLPVLNVGEPPAPPSPPHPDPVTAATVAPPPPGKTEAPAPPLPDFEVRPLVETGIAPSRGGFDAHAIKREFPILHQSVHGHPLVWLDNAATTQKPQAVIDRLKYFYEHENSNIHRAAHALAARATDAYEAARESVRRFVNASSVRDVVFVRGTTEGINLVAQTWGRRHVEAGDEIILTHLEHHANIVPWQLLVAEKGARLRIAPVDDDGQIRLDEYEKLFNARTKFVSFPQVSNALGTVTPAQAMIDIAHRHGVKVLLDGAQSVSHMRTDLQVLKPDFFVFSGHKVFAPTGIGAVVAPAALLDALPPWQGGGNMIQDVTFEKTVFQAAPARFEAGTGNIADAVGLGAALDWVHRVGIDNIGRHEHELLVYGTEKLKTVRGLRIIGTAPDKAGVLSFVIAGHDTQTVSSALDKEGIAVRGGHHCAQPILRRIGLESTVRASLAPYNTFEDLDALAAALCRIVGAR